MAASDDAFQQLLATLARLEVALDRLARVVDALLVNERARVRPPVPSPAPDPPTIIH